MRASSKRRRSVLRPRERAMPVRRRVIEPRGGDCRDRGVPMARISWLNMPETLVPRASASFLAMSITSGSAVRVSFFIRTPYTYYENYTIRIGDWEGKDQ